MKQQRLGIGVVEKIEKFVFEVPIVDIDRHAAHFERGEEPFDVFV